VCYAENRRLWVVVDSDDFLALRHPRLVLDRAADSDGYIQAGPDCRTRLADLVVVVGDVNSTMACTLVSVKLGRAVAHVEAGLRSFDRRMPEEINRMVTDILCDLLFTTSHEAEPNLLREGVDADRIHFVGNVMIDSVHFYANGAEASPVLTDLGLVPKGYGLVTLHRPSNVDEPEVFSGIINALVEIGADCPLLFPVHPRTRKMIQEKGIDIPADKIRLIDPVGYLDFMKLLRETRLVLTDSGGIQEETTVLGVPCLTLRENTERPVTCEVGTNILVGMDRNRIVTEAKRLLTEGVSGNKIPEMWDGKASSRIADVLETYFGA